MKHFLSRLLAKRRFLSVYPLFLAAVLAGCGEDKPSGAPDSGAPAGDTGDMPDAGTGTDGAVSPPDGGSATPGGGAKPGDTLGVAIEEDCEFLQPGHCLLPFPSSRFLIRDAATPTGLRVNFGRNSLPQNTEGRRANPRRWNLMDGFSPSAQLLVFFPDLDASGLASIDTPDASLKPDSRTVLIDGATGERIAHFVELDARANDPARVIAFIRTMERLKENRRYFVGLRGLKDKSGKVYEPSPAFRAYRDRLETSLEAVEQRRPAFEETFAALEKAGVARNELQLAWDFTTASGESILGNMLRIRDQGLSEAGEDGPALTVTRVREYKESENPRLAMRIDGTFQAARFVDSESTGAKFDLDDAGKPKKTGTQKVEFSIIVPRSALDGKPVGTINGSHGLLGSRDELMSGLYQDLANQHRFIVGAVDLMGMAQTDIPTVLEALQEIQLFWNFTDRQHQGMLNTILMGRILRRGLAKLPLIRDKGIQIDPEQHYYLGSSQGGIYGSTICALSPDVKRCVLGVPAINYSLLLQRSTGFDPFQTVLDGRYPDRLQQAIIINLLEMGWERIEGAGYSHLIHRDALPGSQPKDVVLLMALGDFLVTNMATAWQARTMDIPLMTPHNRDIWGVPVEAYPYRGSAVIDFDFGVPEAPKVNQPPRTGKDPHGAIGGVKVVFPALVKFFRDGVLEQFCSDKCNPD